MTETESLVRAELLLSLQTLPSQTAPLTQQRCVSEQGFSLHAEVWLGRRAASKER